LITLSLKKNIANFYEYFRIGGRNRMKRRWLSRRQGLEKEAGLRRIPLQPAAYFHYNDKKSKMSKKYKKRAK